MYHGRLQPGLYRGDLRGKGSGHEFVVLPGADMIEWPHPDDRQLVAQKILQTKQVLRDLADAIRAVGLQRLRLVDGLAGIRPAAIFLRRAHH